MPYSLDKIVIDYEEYKPVKPGDSLISEQINKNFKFLFDNYKKIITPSGTDTNKPLNELIEYINNIDSNVSDISAGTAWSSITDTCNWFLNHDHSGPDKGGHVSFYNLKNRPIIPDYSEMYYNTNNLVTGSLIMWNYLTPEWAFAAGLIIDVTPLFSKQGNNYEDVNFNVYFNGVYGTWGDYSTLLDGNKEIKAFNILFSTLDAYHKWTRHWKNWFGHHTHTYKLHGEFERFDFSLSISGTGKGVSVVSLKLHYDIYNPNLWGYPKKTDMYCHASFINIGMYA